MASTRWVVALAGALTLAAATESAAQAPSLYVSPFAGYNLDGEEYFLGAAVGIPVTIGPSALFVSPGLEYYPSIDGGSFYTFLVDVSYGLPLNAPNVNAYVGGGLSISRASVDVFGTSVSNTNTQLNALGGVEFGSNKFKPFVQADLRFVDGSALILKGGGRISLGR